jgi:hypothetical protein
MFLVLSKKPIMKRIFTFLAMLMLGLSLSGIAAPSGAKLQQPVHKKKDGTADKRFKENKTPPTAPVHTKKDGTPDKRFKENKTPPPAPVHAKKDGTPDKRFKENKTPQPAPVHVKKDGSADKRFKENKKTKTH